MSAPVDVLSVMDRMIESNRRAGIAEVGDFAELIEARSAVAELIEAAEGLIDANDAWMGPGRTDTKTATKRARDALARIQGGDA